MKRFYALSALYRLLGKWPNTYTFTKAVAENVIRKQAGDLPVGIFRPAIGLHIILFIAYIIIHNVLGARKT